MSRKFNGTALRYAIAAGVLGALLFGASAGCKSLGLSENRLQSCETNDDCKKKDPKKPTCSNLRCIACAYDSDCESGLCTNNECKTFFQAGKEDGPEGPPANLDACLSRCSDDQACTNKCHDQFGAKPAPSGEPSAKP
jgi:hypothetical protein